MQGDGGLSERQGQTPDQVNDQARVRSAMVRPVTKWMLALFAVLGLYIALTSWKINRPADIAPRVPTVRPPSHISQIAKTPSVLFKDITKEAGLDFIHCNGAQGEKLLPEALGGGCAFLDYDNDGDQDILLINSTYWPDDERNESALPTMALYRNDGAERFTDVTSASGLDVSVRGMGVAVGDYDRNGDIDVFVSALGGNRLFRNTAGQFQDVTAESGVAGDPEEWSTSAGFLDYDNDGDLDLFVCNYVKWSRQIDLELDFRMDGIGRAYGPPMDFEGTWSYLYQNNADGTFTDVSAAAGIQVKHDATGKPIGKALAISPIDLDEDGHIDIVVANDTVRNMFFHNQGNGTFEEKGRELGIAFDRRGLATGAMGIDAGQYRNNRDLGIFIGNFAYEMSSAYVSQGSRALFADQAIGEGLGYETRKVLTFGLFLFDYDLDGRLDLFQANGHLEDRIHEVEPSQHYQQPAQLFWNSGLEQPTFRVVNTSETNDLGQPAVGRGAAYADIDKDGDLDVLITQTGRSALLLRNDQSLTNHWLRCKLVGTWSNRDAIGSSVELTVHGSTRRRRVMPTRSYLSQVELPITFGLGQQTVIDSLRVIWPDGAVLDVPPPPVDRQIVIRDDRAEFGSLMAMAKGYLDRSNWRMSIRALKMALRFDPQSPPALRNLARAYLSDGQHALALHSLRRAQKREPDSVATQYLTGVALSRQARHKEAIPFFETAARRDPNRSAIRFQLALTYRAEHRHENAVEQLEAALRLDPLHRRALYELAVYAREAEREDEYQARIGEFNRLVRLFGEPPNTPESAEACIHTQAEAGEPGELVPN